MANTAAKDTQQSDDGFAGLPPVQAPTPEQIAARRGRASPGHAPSHPGPQSAQPVPGLSALSAPPPELGPSGAIDTVGERPYREFVLPPSCLGDEWGTSGFGEDSLRFGLTQITVDQHIRSGRLMGAKMDIGTAMIEQQLMCIYTIGGAKVARNRDYKLRWMEAIGPGGRQIVEHCWNKINTVADSDAEQVYELGETKRG